MNPIYVARRRNNIIIKFLCLGAALFGVTWLALILFTLFYNGLSGLNLAVFTQDTPPPLRHHRQAPLPRRRDFWRDLAGADPVHAVL